MANISNKLKGLFYNYLNRLAEEKNKPLFPHRNLSTPRQERINFGDDDFNGVIYFYEWSDINRTPVSFYTLDAFERFLNASQIFMAAYQKELIKHISTSYIACEKNKKNLLIKTCYASLRDALGNKPKGSEDKEPYNVAITRPLQSQEPKVLNYQVYPPKSLIRKPPMYTETNNRWPEWG